MSILHKPTPQLGAQPPQPLSSSHKRSLSPELPSPSKRPRHQKAPDGQSSHKQYTNNATHFESDSSGFDAMLADLEDDDETKVEFELPAAADEDSYDDEDMYADMPGLNDGSDSESDEESDDEVDDEGDSWMGTVTTEEVIGTLYSATPTPPPARPPPEPSALAQPLPGMAPSSSIVLETPSPSTVPPRPQFPEPSSSVEAQAGSALAPEPLLEGFPTLTLEEAVDLDDAKWRPLLQHCHEAIRKLGYDVPKTLHQLRAILLVLSRQQNFIMLLPTGFGKSLLYQFLAKISSTLELDGHRLGGNTLVISPFVALLQDQVDKARALGIPVFNWSARPHGPVNVPPGTRLVFLQPESFIGKSFKECVLAYHTHRSSTDFTFSWHSNWILRGGTPFNRVFIDEFHDAHEGVKQRVEEVWRSVVEGLLALSAQIVLLTATMPPHLVPIYQRLLKRSDFNIIRESSDRPNLSYHFLPAYESARRPQYHYEDIAQELIVSLRERITASSRPRDRILLFLPSLPSVKSFASQHGYLLHHSGRTDEELQQTLARWDSGECAVVVATTAMAQGFDRADIRYTIVADVFYGMTLLSQIMGRCGRDGYRGELFFIASSRATADAPDLWDSESRDAQTLLNRIKTCQRYFTITHMDGPHFAYACTAAPLHVQPVNPCGNCDPESEIHQLALTAIASAAQRYHSSSANRAPGASGPLPRAHALILPSSAGTSSTQSSAGLAREEASVLSAAALKAMHASEKNHQPFKAVCKSLPH